MNIKIFILAIACFVVGTVEMVIAGLLGMISTDLHVSLGVAGQLISVYSFIFAIGGPILSALTSKIERRKLLASAMLIFFIGNILSILSTNFTLLLLSRVILAASCSLIVVISLTIAANIVAPELRGRAIGIIFSGIIASLVLGVPFGTLIASRWGWRMTFVLIAVLTLISFVCILRFLPKIPAQKTRPLQEQVRSLKNKKIISAHFISIFQMIGQFTVYAYITPFLHDIMGLSTGMISVVLLVYGLAGTTGGWIGGSLSDKLGEAKTIYISLIIHAAALFLLPYASHSIYSLLILVLFWCTFNMAATPAIQNYLIKTTPETSNIQLSLNTSSLHIGVAMGSVVGGILVNHFSIISNTWVGALIILFGLFSAIYSFKCSQINNDNVLQ